MITVNDVSSLYLKARATTQTLFRDLDVRWYEPVIDTFPRYLVNQVIQQPQLYEAVKDNPEFIAFVKKYGGGYGTPNR
jgi:hypothetical protein